MLSNYVNVPHSHSKIHVNALSRKSVQIHLNMRLTNSLASGNPKSNFVFSVLISCQSEQYNHSRMRTSNI